MVNTVDVFIYRKEALLFACYGVKTSITVKWLKHAIWNIYSWPEGSYRFQDLNDALLDLDAKLPLSRFTDEDTTTLAWQIRAGPSFKA